MSYPDSREWEGNKQIHNKLVMQTKQEETHGITRFCEWNTEIGACSVGWGSADSSDIKSCHDGSAKKNCYNTIRVPLKNLDANAVERLKNLGDIDD